RVPPAGSPPRLWSAVFVLAASLPPASSLLVLVRNWMNVPYWDQWDFVPLLQRAIEGHLGFADLWARHYEHRIPLSWLVKLAIARMTRCGVRYAYPPRLGFSALALPRLAP